MPKILLAAGTALALLGCGSGVTLQDVEDEASAANEKAENVQNELDEAKEKIDDLETKLTELSDRLDEVEASLP